MKWRKKKFAKYLYELVWANVVIDIGAVVGMNEQTSAAVWAEASSRVLVTKLCLVFVVLFRQYSEHKHVELKLGQQTWIHVALLLHEQNDKSRRNYRLWIRAKPDT